MYVSYYFLICRISHFLNNHVLRFQAKFDGYLKWFLDFLPLFSLSVFLMNLSLLLTFLTSVCLLLGFVGSFLCMQRQYTLSNATNFLKKLKQWEEDVGKEAVVSPLLFTFFRNDNRNRNKFVATTIVIFTFRCFICAFSVLSLL